MVWKAILAGAAMAVVGGAVQAATEKQIDCAHQAAVIAAVQQARLDRVKEPDVFEHVSAQGAWPARYNQSIAIFAGWIYGSDVRMRDLRKQDFGAAWNELCLAQ